MATILRHAATSQTLRAGKGWKDENGIQHPPNWQIWSAEDKAAAGVTEIVPETPPDSRLYTWSQNADGTINKTAKALADSGSGDNLVLGVKSTLKQAVNTQQGSLLDQTDWYIIRKADKATAIPSNVQTWRDAIRTKGDAMKSAIDGAADTNAVAALFVVYTEDSDGETIKSGILYDWPELGT
jgi:hypothetical protein